MEWVGWSLLDDGRSATRHFLYVSMCTMEIGVGALRPARMRSAQGYNSRNFRDF